MIFSLLIKGIECVREWDIVPTLRDLAPILI